MYVCIFICKHMYVCMHIYVYVCTYIHSAYIHTDLPKHMHSYMHIYVADGCTGLLNGLVGSHTRLVIYPTLAIWCQRVVICASLDTGFKGMQVVTYPANIKQLKSC